MLKNTVCWLFRLPSFGVEIFLFTTNLQEIDSVRAGEMDNKYIYVTSMYRNKN